jgi:hypothetical protein
MSTEIKSPRHAAARAYAEAGIPVFPCEVNGKRPACANGFKDATCFLGQIDLWWGIADYNIGLEPERAGWAVIDIDNGEGKNGSSSWAALGFDIPTRRVRTPRGGYHCYFHGSLPPTASKLAKDVDTRGRGSYVLVPPSVVDGKPYTVIDDRDIADLPSGIEAALTKPATEAKSAVSELDLPGNVSRARSLLTVLVDRGDVAREFHGGNDRTYRLSCELLNLGLSPEMARELLEEIWNPHCEPPWDDDALRDIIDHASRYSQNEDGAWAVPSAGEAFGDAISRLQTSNPLKDRSRFYPEDETEQEEGLEPSWLVNSILPMNSTVLLYGPSQSYKSFLALDLALSVSTQATETFGSKPNATGTVFYAALEGKNNIKKARRRAWKVARGIEGRIDNFYVLTAPMVAMPNEVEEFGDQIKARAAGRPVRLIVIDTLAKSMAGLNENDAGDAGRFIRFCDSLVEAFGCTVIAIHHSGKDSDKAARGSSAFLAGFDTVLETKADRKSKTVEFWVRKHKDADEREEPFLFQGKEIGQSLVFFPLDPTEHRKLTADPFEPRRIGSALLELKAVGPASGVSRVVVATQLLGTAEFLTEEDRQAAIAETSKRLAALSKDKLRAYCPNGENWYLPAKPIAS